MNNGRCLPESKRSNKKYKVFKRNKEKVLKYFVIPIVRYDNEYRTISSQRRENIFYFLQKDADNAVNMWVTMKKIGLVS